MGEQTTEYNWARHKESLKYTKIQKPNREVRVDYNALIAYAKEKGIEPRFLSREEQEQFVIPS